MFVNFKYKCNVTNQDHVSPHVSGGQTAVWQDASEVRQGHGRPQTCPDAQEHDPKVPGGVATWRGQGLPRPCLPPLPTPRIR